jgi:hypothetical protein
MPLAHLRVIVLLLRAAELLGQRLGAFDTAPLALATKRSKDRFNTAHSK